MILPKIMSYKSLRIFKGYIKNQNKCKTNKKDVSDNNKENWNKWWSCKKGIDYKRSTFRTATVSTNNYHPSGKLQAIISDNQSKWKKNARFN